MRDESRPRTGRDRMKKFANIEGRDGTGQEGRDAGRDEIGLIHYSVPCILVKQNRIKILWVHRILTTYKH